MLQTIDGFLLDFEAEFFINIVSLRMMSSLFSHFLRSTHLIALFAQKLIELIKTELLRLLANSWILI